MADPTKVFSGLLDILGKGEEAAKAFKPAAKAAEDIFSKPPPALKKPTAPTQTEAGRLYVVPPQPPPAWPDPPKTTAADIDKIFADLKAKQYPASPPGWASTAPPTYPYQPVVPLKPPVGEPPAPPVEPKPLGPDPDAAGQFKGHPPVPGVLPEAQREAARIKGNYVEEAFRGVTVPPPTWQPESTGELKSSKVYATASTKLADMYSGHLMEHPGDAPKEGQYHQGAAVQPVWINTENYGTFDAEGMNRNNPKVDDAIAKARAAGKDGIVLNNIRDEPALTSSPLGPQKVFMTFPHAKNTIKSKFSKAFDPKSENIMHGYAAIGMGLGATGVGMAMAPQDAEASPLPKVFHVSPHSFEEFGPLKERLGTGEVAKVKEGGGPQRPLAGPGYYFAEAEGTRNYYERFIKEKFGQAFGYENTLHADSEEMIDLDKPLEQQPPAVRTVLERLNLTLDKVKEGDAGMASLLRQQGIKGTQFFDKYSREKGEGTRNYVMFDPKTIEITKKVKLAALLGAGGAGIVLDPTGKAQAAEADDIFSKPPPGADIFAKPPPEQKKAIEWPSAKEWKETPGKFAESWVKDTKDIFWEGVEETKKGFTEFGHQFSTENLRKYNQYEKDFEHWENLPELERAVVPPPQKPKDDQGHELSGAQAWGDFLRGVSGAAQAASSFGGGLIRTGLSKPVEELTGVPREVTEFVGGIALGTSGVLSYRPLTTAGKAIVGKVGNELNKIFNPEVIGKGKEFDTLWSAAMGTAARDTETTRAAFDHYWNAVDAMSQAHQVGLTAYIEGRTGGAVLHDPALQPVADAIRDAMEYRKVKLQNLPSTYQMNFVQDYFPHMWKDPKAATAFVNKWYGGKQGTGKFTKKRSIPTVADGLAAGLEPITYNPLEAAMTYVSNADRFIAHNAIFDVGRSLKQVKYFRNQGVHEAPFNKTAERLGLVPLNGRLATRRTKYGDMIAFADQDWARTYNNAVGKGFYGVGGPYGGTISNAYDRALHASNSATMMELGLSAFHLHTMIQEGFVSDIASAAAKGVGAVQALSAGQVKEAGRLLAGSAWSLVKSPAAMITKPIKGWKGQNIYLGRSPGTATNRNLIDYLEKAGGRAVGITHTNEYKMTPAYSYLHSFKRFSDVIDKNAYKSLAKSFKADYAAGKVLPAPMAFMARQVGRTMATIAEPLFKVYIPKMKTGAFMENMQDWLKANPLASEPEKVEMAKKIWKSIDNRFGEMVQDNIFWPKMLKQAAMVGMRSYSWNLGTVREIAGGAKSAVGSMGKSIGIRGQTYDPKAGYVVALPIGAAIMGGVYQYMKTGKGPESPEDLFHPRTGGTVPGVGGRGQVPERAMLPGYMKDVFGWYDDARAEAYNKLGAAPSAVWEIMTNKTGPYYKPEDILRPEGTMPEWASDYFHYFMEKFLPISIKQSMHEKKGTRIGSDAADIAFGPKPAGAAYTDPAGLAAAKHGAAERVKRERLKKEMKEKRIYGAPE